MSLSRRCMLKVTLAAVPAYYAGSVLVQLTRRCAALGRWDGQAGRRRQGVGFSGRGV